MNSLNDLAENKVFLVLVAVVVFNFLVLGAGTLIVSKTVDLVIQKLEKDYCPSPYGPGLDPDKVNMDRFYRRNPSKDRQYFGVSETSLSDKTEQEKKEDSSDQESTSDMNPEKSTIKSSSYDAWKARWEKEMLSD